MIVYEFTVIDEPVIARFETCGISDTSYWAGNITKNISRKIGTKAFFMSLYKLAIKHTQKRKVFYGKMNCVPNIEFGKEIAKDRLLKKYNELEEKVYKEFLKYVATISCVNDLVRSYKQAVNELEGIRNNIKEFNIVQQIFNQHREELL